jgi:hypothetical protein
MTHTPELRGRRSNPGGARYAGAKRAHAESNVRPLLHAPTQRCNMRTEIMRSAKQPVGARDTEVECGAKKKQIFFSHCDGGGVCDAIVVVAKIFRRHTQRREKKEFFLVSESHLANNFPLRISGCTIPARTLHLRVHACSDNGTLNSAYVRFASAYRAPPGCFADRFILAHVLHFRVDACSGSRTSDSECALCLRISGAFGLLRRPCNSGTSVTSSRWRAHWLGRQTRRVCVLSSHPVPRNSGAHVTSAR